MTASSTTSRELPPSPATPAAVLQTTEHRPWPLPREPWIITQEWCDLLFAHWPLSPEALLPLIPAGLQLDTFDGQAWVGVVPFRLTGVRWRPFPEVPLLNRFLEINVRTYVIEDGKPGVLFLSMEADNIGAIALGRYTYFLPYLYAQISLRTKGATVTFKHRRLDSRKPDAEFSAGYRPIADAQLAQPGTLEHWLTERYCCFGIGPGGRICRADIHHQPWRLQRAAARLWRNSMASSFGIELDGLELHPPLLHYSRYIKAYIWPIEWLQSSA